MEMDGGQKNQIIVFSVPSTDRGKKSLDGQRARLQSNAYFGEVICYVSLFNIPLSCCEVHLPPLVARLLIAILWRMENPPKRSDDENPSYQPNLRVR